MVHLSFRWWVWVIAALLIYATYRGPSTMAWAGLGVLHLTGDGVVAFVRGLAGVQHCGHACRPG
jgi:hypothetical protein